MLDNSGAIIMTSEKNKNTLMYKDGLLYLRSLDADDMLLYLKRCTSDFEYCPIPGYSTTAQYNGECPRWFVEGKEPEREKGHWGRPVDISGDCCEQCVREWLEGKGVKKKNEVWK